MQSYIYQVFHLDVEKDVDIIDFLAELKKKRQAAAFIKRAIRVAMTKEA